MAVTSVDLDKSKILEIKKLTGMKTDREVLDAALNEKLARLRQKDFLNWLAQNPLSDEQINAVVIDYPV